MAKVFIGVGHGAADSGAVANGYREKDLNLDIALACNAELKKFGVVTRMSRTKDETDTLQQEIAESNAFNPDLAVDIHNNAGGGDGVEVWYSIVGGLSKTMAANIIYEVQKIGQNSRGIKTRKWGNTDYYGFVRETKAPACIVECAFVDNANDIKILDTPDKRKKMGVAIAKGLMDTLGIDYNKPVTPTPEPKPRKPVSIDIDGINCGRTENTLILYAGGKSTNTNKWGTEVAIDKNGRAINYPVYESGNMAIPSGGFVLSGHGTKSKWLLESIKKGDKITVNIKRG